MGGLGFYIQAGEWKNGNENFVGTYGITKVGSDQFVINYEAYEDDNFKVVLSDVNIWVNDTGEFLSSPGNQKGKAFAVEPGETFEFYGDQMYVFIHFIATYYERTNKGWKRTGQDSATGYDPYGRLSKGNWFMYNTVDIFDQLPVDPVDPVDPVAPPVVPEEPVIPESDVIHYTVRYVSILEDKLLGQKVNVPVRPNVPVTEIAREFDGYTVMDPDTVIKTVIDGEVIIFYYLLNMGG